MGSMAEAPGDSTEYYASLGPWVTAEAVAEYLDLSKDELLQWTEGRRLLGVKFADGNHYYPSRQFKDGHSLSGLDRVLDALSPAFVASASQAGWLAAVAYRGDDLTRWDFLRRGEVELVLGWAKHDVARMLRP